MRKNILCVFDMYKVKLYFIFSVECVILFFHVWCVDGLVASVGLIPIDR